MSLFVESILMYYANKAKRKEVLHITILLRLPTMVDGEAYNIKDINKIKNIDIVEDYLTFTEKAGNYIL